MGEILAGSSYLTYSLNRNKVVELLRNYEEILIRTNLLLWIELIWAGQVCIK